jgi:hypothetical protein
MERSRRRVKASKVRRWAIGGTLLLAGTLGCSSGADKTDARGQVDHPIDGPARTGGVLGDGAVVPTGGLDAPPGDGAVVRSGGIDAPMSFFDAGRDVAQDLASAAPDAGARPTNCGGPGQACCPMNTCYDNGCCTVVGASAKTRLCLAEGMECVNQGVCTGGMCEGDGGFCGGVGSPCCFYDVCSASGATCVPGDGGKLCVACGLAGQPCCYSGILTGQRWTCETGTRCTGTDPKSTCEPCGGLGQRCCEDNVCTVAGTACVAGDGGLTCQAP